MDTKVTDRAHAEGDTTQTIRIRVDRRKPSLRSIYHGMFQPRRRQVRRQDDEPNAFLDWHPRSLLIASVAVLLLSLADGLISVRLVTAGAREINPLLALVVHDSPVAFALTKWLLTACGVVALVASAHARVFRTIKGAAVLHGVLAGYAVLVLYGLLLTVSIPP